MTKDEKTSELVRLAVQTLKTHAAPMALNEPAVITAYYAIFNGPAIWKPGDRPTQVMLAPMVKMKARFKRSFVN